MGRILLAVTLLSTPLAVAGCASLEGARLYRSGTEALERGDAARATRELSRAAELLPQASEIQNHLGLAHLAEGRKAEARRAFERAVLLDCDNGSARHNLAVLLAEPGSAHGAAHGAPATATAP